MQPCEHAPRKEEADAILEGAAEPGCSDVNRSSENGPSRSYVVMPQLSDRCGGSHDDSVVIPVPEGVTLPDSVQVISLDK